MNSWPFNKDLDKSCSFFQSDLRKDVPEVFKYSSLILKNLIGFWFWRRSLFSWTKSSLFFISAVIIVFLPIINQCRTLGINCNSIVSGTKLFCCQGYWCVWIWCHKDYICSKKRDWSAPLTLSNSATSFTTANRRSRTSLPGRKLFKMILSSNSTQPLSIDPEANSWPFMPKNWSDTQKSSLPTTIKLLKSRWCSLNKLLSACMKSCLSPLSETYVMKSK